MFLRKSWCLQIQVGGLLTVVWTGRIASFDVGLAGSGQVFILTFLLKCGLNFTTTRLEKRKVYVSRNFFAWEILDVTAPV